MTQPSPTPIKGALQRTAPIDSIEVQGWVRTRRDSKDFSFIELNDGSTLRNLQIIAKNTLPNYPAVQRLTTGASISVTGALVPSQGKGQKWELVADQIEVVGTTDDSYPLQKKGHTPEFLREIAYLRPRSNLFSSVFCDLKGNMDLAEEFVKYLVAEARQQCADEMELFGKFVDKELLARLDFVVDRPFQRITYAEAVELLKTSGEKFEFPIDYGLNLQSEHERWLTEKHFQCPVTVFNYPKEIKPFYMRVNDD